MTEFQRTYLERLMRDSKGNLSAASRLSGIDRANLRRALQKHKKNR
jgi:DNA-binding protein Fis